MKIILQVKPKSSLLFLKPKQNGKIWRKVIKQKYPGAVHTNNKKSVTSKGKAPTKGKSIVITTSRKPNSTSTKFGFDTKMSLHHHHLCC